MSGFLDVAWFLAGAYLSMRFIAALFRVIDLWYAIGKEYVRVLRGMLLWSALAAGAWALASGHRAALRSGFLAFAVLHLSIALLASVIVRIRVAQMERLDGEL